MSKKNKRSAGLLMYRTAAEGTEVLLVHPGGPYWAKKNEGSWSIPKGEYENDEPPLSAAIREFKEETGFDVSGPLFALGSVRQKSGKVVTAWGFEGNCDPKELVSNTCEIEWPPRSGLVKVIPEVDRGEWYAFQTARSFIREEQLPFLEALESYLNSTE